MTTPIPPRPVTQTAIPVQNVLSYAANQVFERAVFRLIGWIAIVLAVLLLLSLVLDLLLLPQMKLPDWWMMLTGQTQRWYGDRWRYRMDYLADGALPVATKLLALPLLAGGIGCLRRYSRTRWWMLLYAVPQLVVTLFWIAVPVLKQWNFSGPAYVMQRNAAAVLYTVAFYIPSVAWSVLIIYLMTRPYVSRLFAKAPY